MKNIQKKKFVEKTYGEVSTGKVVQGELKRAEIVVMRFLFDLCSVCFVCSTMFGFLEGSGKSIVTHSGSVLAHDRPVVLRALEYDCKFLNICFEKRKRKGMKIRDKKRLQRSCFRNGILAKIF